jgi:transcriptional regulator with XRE-family HTH domain
VGDNIRTARQARGLTQEQLARTTGVTAGTAAKWEAGRIPSWGAVLRISHTLGVPVSALLDTDQATTTRRVTR